MRRTVDCCIVAAGFLAVMLGFDLVIGRTLVTSGLGAPEDRAGLSRYFEHGRSVEGKIRRMIGHGDERHPLFTAGWFESQYPPIATTGKTISVYGMSFAMHATSSALEFLDDDYQLRSIGGPAAPLSHSYAALEQDPHWQDSDLVVLGILASSLPKIQSLTHMTGSWEAPCPHTYPRYDLDGDSLLSTQPTVASLQQLTAALDDESLWSAFVEQLSESDSYFDPFVFSSVMDNSALVRIARRGWGQSQTRAVDGRLHSASGYSESISRLGRALLTAFAQKVRSGGKEVVVVLFNNRGFADHLHDTLATTLDRERLRYVSTHRIAPAQDLSNFQPDGHFTTIANRKISKQLAAAIQDAIK